MQAKRTPSGRRIGTGVSHWAPRMSVDLNGDDADSVRASLDEPDLENLAEVVEESIAENRVLGTDVSHYAPRMSMDDPIAPAVGRSGSLADLAPRLDPSSAKRAAPSKPAVAANSIRGSQSEACEHSS